MTRCQSHLDPKLIRYARGKALDEKRAAFGAALRRWLEGREMTMADLDRVLGSRGGLSRAWVAGEWSPSADNLAALIAMGFQPPEGEP